MREIKFRCWNAHGKVMHSWGELVEKNKIHLLANQKPSYAIMQYTGLKDKNGTEIYEGDIALFDGENLKCIIETDGVWFENDNLTMRHDDFEKYGEPLIVIGNIHQNPELLPC